MDNHTKDFQRWLKSLERIETESRQILTDNILGDGGNTKDNSIVIIVNHHALACLNAIKGVME